MEHTRPVAVDAMGGDFAPAAIVQGALQALDEAQVPVILVGDREQLAAELGPAVDRPGITIHHASQVVEMEESPSLALRRKPDSSVSVAARLVREGIAGSTVSAGNSGAAMGAALLGIGTVPGVERPAIASLIPSKKGRFILLDAGANIDCKPSHLLQFARMGAIYAQAVLGIEEPTIGLLSIGEEATKGNELTKIAHAMLATQLPSFRGNVEGKDIVNQAVDVVVCDGFVGNVVLKVGEGFADLFISMLKAELARFPDLLANAQLGEALQRLGRSLSYAEYGGAVLLGVKGTCVISHGRSSAKAISKAIEVAYQATERGIPERIAESFAKAQVGA